MHKYKYKIPHFFIKLYIPIKVSNKLHDDKVSIIIQRYFTDKTMQNKERFVIDGQKKTQLTNFGELD